MKRPRLKRSVRIDMGIDILFILCSPEAPSGGFGIHEGLGSGWCSLCGFIERRGGLSTGLKWTRWRRNEKRLVAAG